MTAKFNEQRRLQLKSVMIPEQLKPIKFENLKLKLTADLNSALEKLTSNDQNDGVSFHHGEREEGGVSAGGATPGRGLATENLQQPSGSDQSTAAGTLKNRLRPLTADSDISWRTIAKTNYSPREDFLMRQFKPIKKSYLKKVKSTGDWMKVPEFSDEGLFEGQMLYKTK